MDIIKELIERYFHEDHQIHSDQYDRRAKSTKEKLAERDRVLKSNEVISSPKTAVILSLSCGGLVMVFGFGITIWSYVELLKFGFDLSGFFIVVIIFWVVLSGVLSYRTLRLIRSSFQDNNVGQKGTSRFTTMREIEEQYKCVPEYPGSDAKSFPGYGGLPVACKDGKMWIDDEATNAYIVGITRSGKGELISLRMIDTYSRAEKQSSLVILDMKYDIIKMTKKELEKRGYKSYVFNFDQPQNGNGYNPLALPLEYYKRGGEDLEVAKSLCLSLAYTYFASKEGAKGSDNADFFLQNACSAFSAMCIAHMDDCLKEDLRKSCIMAYRFEVKKRRYTQLSDEEKRKADLTYENVKDKTIEEIIASCDSIPLYAVFKRSTKEEAHINIPSTLNMFREMGKEFKNEKSSVLDLYFSKRPPYDTASAVYSSIEVSGGKTKGSILSQALIKLTLYSYENIAQMSSVSDMNLEEIGFGDQPVVLYLELPFHDRSRDALAINMIEQIYQANERAASKTRELKCKRRVVMHLDEIAQCPPIKAFDTQLSVGLGVGIIHNLFIQDDRQLRKSYGDDADTIKSNCGNWVYIQSAHNETAEAFSRKLGKKTQVEVTRQGKRYEMDKALTENIIEQPLMNENQLMELMPGELIITRVMKRKDLKGNSVKPHPIANFEEDGRAYKMRYEYMSDVFPNADTVMVEDLNLPKIKYKKHSEIYYNWKISVHAQKYAEMREERRKHPNKPPEMPEEQETEFNKQVWDRYREKKKAYDEEEKLFTELKKLYMFDDPVIETVPEKFYFDLCSLDIDISEEDSVGQVMMKLMESGISESDRYRFITRLAHPEKIETDLEETDSLQTNETDL